MKPGLRRRASTTPDVRRIGKAVSHPGIDPRVWAVRGWVEEVHVDAEHGTFVDVTLQTGEEETARVGEPYAGSGYGDHSPLEVDDEVLLVAPMGNYNAGLVVVARLHSASDKPPQEAVDHPADRVIRVRDGQTIRIVVAGAGNVVVKVGDGKVLLGDETGTEPVMRRGDPVDVGRFNILGGVGNLMTGIQHISPDGVITNFSITGAPPPAACDGKATGGSTKVEGA